MGLLKTTFKLWWDEIGKGQALVIFIVLSLFYIATNIKTNGIITENLFEVITYGRDFTICNLVILVFLTIAAFITMVKYNDYSLPYQIAMAGLIAITVLAITVGIAFALTGGYTRPYGGSYNYVRQVNLVIVILFLATSVVPWNSAESCSLPNSLFRLTYITEFFIILIPFVNGTLKSLG